MSIVALSLHGADRYWTGFADDQFTNADNWEGGNVPQDNDYSDKAIFDDANLTGVASKTCQVPNRMVASVDFKTAGWGITVGTYTISGLSSSGTGTNTIHALKTAKKSISFDIGENNVVIANNIYIDDDKTLTFQGGGTFVSKKTLGYTWINKTISLKKIIFIIENSTPLGDNKGTITLTSTDSELRLKTTVTGAESHISAGRIKESLEQGLSVTDIGGGYVSITVAPPKIPGTVLIIE